MTDLSNTPNGTYLRAALERIEKLEQEKADIAELVKEVYAEAKGNGYDSKILKRIVSLRKKREDERKEEHALLEVYASAMQLSLF